MVKLVGRDTELEQLISMAAEGTITSILGPAGVGKTTLVDHFAHKTQVPVRGYAHLVNARDYRGVVEAVAEAVGAVGRAGRDDLDRHIGRTLNRMGTGVVILDNAEHVHADVSALVQRWRQAAPEICWVITSQVRLHLVGEHLLDLSPLRVPADDTLAEIQRSTAIDLLRLRMQSIRHLPEPVPSSDLVLMGQIVRALDGLPLAIELAASRMRVLSLSEVLHHLEDRTRLLRGSLKTKGDQRHVTLEAALEWSWSQLTDWAQTALAQCSVFAGGFEYGAAERIIDISNHDAPPDIVDVLEQLLDHSVLQRREQDGITWFSILASVQTFAQIKLGDESEVMARYVQYYGSESGDVARRAWRKSGPDHQWLARNRQNLQKVVETIGEHGQCGSALSAILGLDEVLYTTSLATHLSRLRTVMAHVDAQGNIELWGFAAITQARVLRFLGQTQESLALLQAVVKIAEVQDLREVHVSALCDLARAQRMLKETADAEKTLLLARELSEEWGFQQWFMSATMSLGLVAFAAGCLGEARMHLKNAHEYHIRMGTDQSERVTAVNLGRVHVELGELNEAERCFSRSIELGALIDHEWSMGYGHYKLGEVATVRGQTEKAFACFETALDMLRRAGDGPHEAEAIRAYADACLIARDYPRALDLYEQALALAAAYGVGRSEVQARYGIAWAHGLQGEFDSGAEMARVAVVQANRIGDPTLIACAHAALISIVRLMEGGEMSADQLLSTNTPLEPTPRIRMVSAFRTVFCELDELDESLLGERLRALSNFESDTLGSQSWFETQILERILRSRVSKSIALNLRDEEADLRVSATGFAVEQGQWVDLSTKSLLCRFLGLLVDAYGQTPGRAVPLDDVVAALWPDERMYREAGATRVYSAVANLRRSGLRGILLRKEGGYLICPEIKLVRIDG